MQIRIRIRIRNPGFNPIIIKTQCFGSGFNQVSGPDPGGQKRHKNSKKFWKISCWMSFLKAEGFSCSLDVLRGGLEINRNFWSKKYYVFSAAKLFLKFLSSAKMLDPDPDSINPDPKHQKKTNQKNFNSLDFFYLMLMRYKREKIDY